jgi:hypothetical protein
MSEIIQTIARVRRAMPRNPDVMAICDELEKQMLRGGPWKQGSVVLEPVGSKTKLSRAEIQKNYRVRKKDRK